MLRDTPVSLGDVRSNVEGVGLLLAVPVPHFLEECLDRVLCRRVIRSIVGRAGVIHAGIRRKNKGEGLNVSCESS